MLRKEEIYTNLKKCIFLTIEVHFLGFVVSTNGVSADPEKIKAIEEWPEPKTIEMSKVSTGSQLSVIDLFKGLIPSWPQ